MSKYFNTPDELVAESIAGCNTKAGYPLKRLILLSIIAGAFVAFGAQASSLATHNISDYGIAKTIAGTIFPVGLMMIILFGGNLFTSNCLISMSVMHKQVTLPKFGKNLFIVYFSNFIGAGLIAFLIFLTGQYDVSDGALGAYTIKVALGKVHIPFVSALVSGILCNVLVCTAVLMAGAAKDVTGKCLAIFFPIWTFVISGFEHSIANMYYITAGLLAKSNPEYVSKLTEHYGYDAADLSSLTIKTFLVDNLVPVTIGNLIGGAIVTAVIFYKLYGTKHH